MSFGMYLIAFICSPLYFAIRQRWGAFVINLVLYGLALLTVMIFGIGIFFWLLGVAHAMWDLSMTLRERGMQRQAELIAKSMSKPDGA